MDIQSTLTLAIEVVFWAFVSLMIFDFIDGLWVIPLLPVAPPTEGTAPAIASDGRNIIAAEQPQPEATPTIAAQSGIAMADPWEEPRFTQLPDPWELAEIPTTPILPQAVVLQFPTLRLLPPVAEVQPTTNKPKATTKPKSTKTKASKPTNKAATQTRSKSRKSAA